jgi:redox-sensitive bicupin YhaK (pirin superfamily)
LALDEGARQASRVPSAMVIEGRPRDLGGLSVVRLLPSRQRQMVGPFIFFDQFGPAAFPPGAGMDVRPHPHINLATVTYLFEGEIVHRDSLGFEQAIRPGEVNWMTAGRGIVHSERTGPVARAAGGRMHGIQLWVALPAADEETEPAFHHHPASALPELRRPGAILRLIAGTAFGLVSPVPTFSPLFYIDAALDDGARIELPRQHPERAVHVVAGRVHWQGGGESGSLDRGPLAVLPPDVGIELRAEGPSRVVLLGGAPLEGERHIWWNFVSSRRERIEEAARAWKEGRFPKVRGDEEELIPLPER